MIMHEARRNPLQLVPILVLISQLLVLFFPSKGAVVFAVASPGCQESCGGVTIPYPFGIGENCSFSRDYNVECRPGNTKANRKNGTRPYINAREILDISIPLGQLSFSSKIAWQCYNTTTNKDDNESMAFTWVSNHDSRPFWLNNEKNKLIVIGCNAFAYVELGQFIDSTISAGCLATCDDIDSLSKYGTSCSGIGCCLSSLPKLEQTVFVDFDKKYNQSRVHDFSRCSYAMVVDNSTAGFVFNPTNITRDDLRNLEVPVVFDWVIADSLGARNCDIALTNISTYACRSSNSTCLNSPTGMGYKCNCSNGYQGNPYLPDGCQDIDECATQNPCSKRAKCQNLPGRYRCSCSFGWRTKDNDTQNCELNLALVIGGCAGTVALSFIGFAILVIFFERRKFSKAKEKYFQQHGGWILLEKIKSNQGFGFTIFTKQQVEQATNNFDSDNIIGHGGQGTVYKGSLRDQAVAIKKCKIVDESKRKEFGKEMVILSQINHKNIVKLLGCCLEVEIPMLVYEFIPNGTLHQYIHSEKNGKHFSLRTRIKIAHESADALAYLHSSASPPIFHGDVKSLSILLDQNQTAKVSDFGASVLAPTDEAQFVTFVQGTCGYLDPEYMQTSQLTDKSDVYSFGVVLLELLTSKPVFDFGAPEEERGLSSRFLYAMEDNKLLDLLDDEIVHEDDMELITKIAELAKECLNMKGVDRPTMKEVAEELDRISKLHQHPWREESQYKDSET